MTGLFQSPSFLSFLSETGFLDPFSYSTDRGGRPVGHIQGYIQKDGGPVKRWLSRRAIVNGGPALSDDITEKEVEELLKSCIKGLNGRAIYLETRNFHDYSEWRHVFERCGFHYEPHYDYVIDTSTLETAEENLGKSRKRDIRTSLRDGATIVEDPSPDQVEAFYEILKDLYDTRVKTPLFPLDFFTGLNRTGFSKFLLVEFQGDIVGGTVCVFDEETVYEWFACGKDGIAKSVFPSTLATWAGIKFAAESGRQRFDMMGAGAPGDGGYGVRDFKAKFGGELVEYGRFKYICNKPLYKIGELGVKVMKKLK